ncbi:MAG: glycosyltransferase, partial [Pseudomonadales bacterium]|nr:glycosyltransferase [Pseudomonadales bacterium]
DINRMLGSADRTGDIEKFVQEIANREAIIDRLNESLQDKEKSLHQKRLMVAKLNESLHGLNQRLDASVEQLQELQAAHQRLNRMHEELDREVKVILNSFSWKVTRPLRFLKRIASTYLWQPVKPFFVRQVLNNPALHEKLIDIKSDSSVAAGDGVVFCNIDSPSNAHRLFSEELLIRGWSFSDKGSVRIRVTIDDLEYSDFAPHIYRRDVLNLYKGMDQAKDSGFVERIPLPHLQSGKHRVSLSAQNDRGAENHADAEFFVYKPEEIYNAWRRYRTDEYTDSLVKDKNELAKYEAQPTVIVLEFRENIERLEHSLKSLKEQYHREFEIVVVGINPSTHSELVTSLKEQDWIAEVFGEGEFKEALGFAIERGSWVLSLWEGTVLTPSALLQLLVAANRAEADLVYSDHDTEFDDGSFGDPEFTFGWSPEHLISRNYIGSTFLISTTYLKACLEKLPADSGWKYRALLELTRDISGVERIPSVLWSQPPASDPERAAERSTEAGLIRNFLQDYYPDATLSVSDTSRSVTWGLPNDPAELPLVSIIMPTTGKLKLLKPCMESLNNVTTYPNYEIIVLDNSRGKNPEGIEYLKQKNIKIIECDEEFNWAKLNNVGAAAANGSLLLFLNDDIEIIQEDWLQEMVRQARKADVGAVGCRLLYNNGHLQHAGVVLVNYGGGCLHIFHKMPMGSSIYRRLDQCVREVSANTGACLMVSKEKFEDLKGFDEELSIVGNDIDLCLRLIENGFRNIWTPRTTLIHHESISRESNTPKENELAMWSRWGDQFNKGDTFYNPNLDTKKVDCSQEFDVAEDILLDKLADIRPQSGVDQTSEHKPGVNLIGYIRADMGLGEAIRSDARALHSAGIDFGIVNFEQGNPSRMTNMSWRHKEILSTPYDVNLIHINADFLSLVREELPDHFFEGKYNIAYWAWELEELPDEWLLTLDYIDEIWVPSEFVNAAVSAKVSQPVVTIPHNVDLRPSFLHPRSYFNIPEHGFVFLAMYDTRSIAARKNPDAAVEAFLQVFDPDDSDVILVLKVNNSSTDDMETLKEKVSGRKNVLLLEDSYDRDEINSLLTIADCFVSLHRSEGFGLGPAEVMCLGKPCILTNWSGNTDYMTQDNCFPVDYELVTLEEDHGPYLAGQRWAEADVRQASEFMRQIAADPTLGNRIGKAAKQTISESFSPNAVGERVIARLNEIRQLRDETQKQAPVAINSN